MSSSYYRQDLGLGTGIATLLSPGLEPSPSHHRGRMILQSIKLVQSVFQKQKPSVRPVRLCIVDQAILSRQCERRVARAASPARANVEKEWVTALSETSYTSASYNLHRKRYDLPPHAVAATLSDPTIFDFDSFKLKFDLVLPALFVFLHIFRSSMLDSPQMRPAFAAAGFGFHNPGRTARADDRMTTGQQLSITGGYFVIVFVLREYKKGIEYRVKCHEGLLYARYLIPVVTDQGWLC
ncbi:hypothetical protein V8E53_005430 [Lactarius tabidus]